MRQPTSHQYRKPLNYQRPFRKVMVADSTNKRPHNNLNVWTKRDQLRGQQEHRVTRGKIFKPFTLSGQPRSYV